MLVKPEHIIAFHRAKSGKIEIFVQINKATPEDIESFGHTPTGSACQLNLYEVPVDAYEIPEIAENDKLLQAKLETLKAEFLQEAEKLGFSADLDMKLYRNDLPKYKEYTELFGMIPVDPEDETAQYCFASLADKELNALNRKFYNDFDDVE